jgi:anti-anti-sigma factor
VLDLDAASELRDALQHASAADATTIEIDLRAVEFIDSLGLSVLFAARARALQEGKLFAIVVPPVLHRTFELAGLDHLVAVDGED